jgi:biopolymer transport protein ExbB/TolQ
VERNLAVSRFTSFLEWVIRLPLVWGGVATLAFYATITQQWVDSPGASQWLAKYHLEFVTGVFALLRQYTAGHRVEYVICSIFFVGLAAIVMRFIYLAGQFASLDRIQLDPIPIGGQPASASEGLLAQLAELPPALHQHFLTRRLHDALEFVRRKDSADSLDDHLRHLQDVEAIQIQSAYALLRLIVWAIPILGLLGTVIGITLSIGNLNPQTLEESVTKVTGGLGIAFDHTAEALTLTMVLMFLKSWVERVEDRLMAEVDNRVADELVGRFQSSAGGSDPNVAAIRRMSEQVIDAVEELAARQAQVWKSSIDETHQQWAEVSVAASKVVKESLSSTVRESLDRHAQLLNDGAEKHATTLATSATQYVDKMSRGAQETTTRLREGLEKLAELLVEALHQHGEVLIAGETTLAEENRRHLSEVEGALGEAMARAADRQEKLVRQSEHLLKDMQVALVGAAEATVRQQEQLIKQGDVMLQVVGATGQVKQLEEALNDNLASLAQAHNFEETVLNLAATIQLLSARVGRGLDRPAAVDLTGKKPPAQAA